MRALALLLGSCLTLACTDDVLGSIRGSVEVEVRNVRLETATVRVVVEPEGAREQRLTAAPQLPSLLTRFESVSTGLATVRAAALDAEGAVLDERTVFPVAVAARAQTRVLIDFASGEVEVAPPPDDTPGVCLDASGAPDVARDVLCGRCTEPDGAITAVPDDEACGTISCDGLDRFRLESGLMSGETARCVFDDHAPITTERCARVGVCLPADDPATCAPPLTTTVLVAGPCEAIANCAGVGPPSLVTVPEGTPCGSNQTCAAGVCVATEDPPPPPPPPPPPQPIVGCSDGGREGFLDTGTFPAIAACAGAFAVAGITVDALAPQCGRAAGDDGAQLEGAGCSAADLCAEGWHVCRGKSEVLAKAPGGCAAAVPPGTPDKALFFAVAQHSVQGSVCDDASLGDNDVFGCGNLGTSLTADKNCGPLTRVLASTAPNRCGFNEAEPPLGPWECRGDGESHLHEGAVVTKAGCPGTSCSYDGQPVGNSSKGGVLCCAD